MDTERSCDCCNRIAQINVHASSLGPYSFGYCSECDKNGTEPVDVLTSIIKNQKCIHGTRADWVRETHTVYVNGKYMKMQDFLDENKDKFIIDFEIDKDYPTFLSRFIRDRT